MWLGHCDQKRLRNLRSCAYLHAQVDLVLAAAEAAAEAVGGDLDGLRQLQPGEQLRVAWQPLGRASRALEAPPNIWLLSGSLWLCLFRHGLACAKPVHK